MSILIVLGEHTAHTYNFPFKARLADRWIFEGEMGVRFFFVISGFLITYLLLREHHRTGGLSLRNFYARRALRIFPVYFAFLAVVFGLQKFSAARWWQHIAWANYLTFTANYTHYQPYFMLHLWSLAVEEQFYLFWPVVLLLAGMHHTRRLLRLLAVAVFLAPFCRLVHYTGYNILLPEVFDPLFYSQSFLFFIDSLSVGCIAAILFVRYRHELENWLARRMAATALMAAALIVISHLLTRLFPPNPFIRCGAYPVQSVGFAVLMLQSIFFARHFKPLNWAMMRQIGVLSYSIYIWQMLFAENPDIYGWPRTWFMSWRGWWLPVLAVAALSYYCLERPVFRWRARFRAGT